VESVSSANIVTRRGNCFSHVCERLFTPLQRAPYHWRVQIFHWYWRCVVLTQWWDELREVLWLASVVGGLSAAGVILAVAAAVTGSV